MRDVLVIGIGLAGLVAAIRCREAGLGVTLVAQGVGSTHLAPGTIDVLGYDPELVESPSESLPGFLQRNPEHPYGRIQTTTLARSLEWFGARFDGYRYTGSLNENLLLPTAIGAVRPSALVPETMSAGDLRHGGRFLFVGLRQLKDFWPALAAQNTSNAKVPSGAAVAARGVLIEPPTGGEADLTGLAFARLLDDRAFVRVVTTQISAHLEDGESVGLPAVLGVRRAHEVWTELQDTLGCPVFEVPSLPPSVPGIRLYEILRAQFARAGGRLIIGAEAVGADTEGDRVTTVHIRAAGRVKAHPARHFVLASGGFAAGAIEMDSQWKVRERIFGLPVAGVPEDVERRFSPRYFDRHPMGRAGIRVDDSLRPLDNQGNRVHSNLSVVGACLAGAEPWREKSGDGISLASGYAAAGTIIEEAK
ncbi:MAG: glycerol-3-phosphate dehydrogenase subunit GlpB [Actinomycetota bacterium]